ncbi:inovirus Gp2 family protein [Acinetobacter sp. ANC 4635]|uniref:YagK/YfjJ domain-containing protein n=1 Tax=Acinetobacter sp. ANC 4635 TaxID=2529846 RepID=UPI00103C5A2C|nr:inovirus-type Gp2 protein [Acinetobacter sp. ANC 4635]TCB32817.1 inovirus Gp2 family protein [Acinetobacter sp. ANC 4635]
MSLSYHLYSESACLIHIETFVFQALAGELEGLSLKTKLAQLIPAFWFHYSEQYEYAHVIQAFRDALVGLEMNKPMVNSDACDIDHFLTVLRTAYLKLTHSDIDQHSINEHHNTESLRYGLNTVIQHYSRVLLVRVDLYFSAQAQKDMTIHRCHQYLQILLNRLSNRDGCFSNLHWWAWALEQGLQRGYHIHLLLVYDGHRHQNDYYLGLEVGRYWRDVLTDGEGEFYTSNQPKIKHRYSLMNRLGIGMIYRDNPIAIENALNASAYLVSPEKEIQMLRVKKPNMRTFGTAQFDVVRRRGIH